MRRVMVGSLGAWWAAKKEHVYAVAIMAVVPLFLVFAAPYGC